MKEMSRVSAILSKGSGKDDGAPDYSELLASIPMMLDGGITTGIPTGIPAAPYATAKGVNNMAQEQSNGIH